ncbi:molybdenum ABC transporter ATP-binding protein [Paraglaciecola sp.]|uniref:molybdenum ABC transporter ATP-binding protein n=1 Tax=Paraglaciecola sp. TaxID=1920173 RepID=UPI0030F3CB5B
MTDSYIQACFKLAFAGEHKQGFKLDVDLQLPSKGIIALFGHSGSGKTTLLRCIAGLQPSDQGLMQVNGKVWQDKNFNLPTHKRGLAYVFQESSLLPHLSVKANLHYALKRAKQCSTQSLAQIIEMMSLSDLLNHTPGQLSGGERQRVAIARALLTEPTLLLMDEPLASLDLTRKQEILPYLEKLKHSANVAIIYVTHDINEVARLADYLVVMEQGKVVVTGELNQVLPHISTLAGLSEDVSVVLDTKLVARDPHWNLIQVKLKHSSDVCLWLRDSGEAIGNTMRIRLQAKDVSISLSDHHDSSIINRLAATVKAFQPDQDKAMVLVELRLDDCIIMARITQRSREHLQLREGSQVWAQIKSVAIVN